MREKKAVSMPPKPTAQDKDKRASELSNRKLGHTSRRTSDFQRSSAVTGYVSGTEAKAVNLSRDCALAFIEADDNGDGVLDWTEFKAAFRSIRGQRPGSVNALDDTELRSLFDAIDKDQSGSIDMDEYFLPQECLTIIWNNPIPTRCVARAVHENSENQNTKIRKIRF